jgi:hypothetical protein
MNAPATGSIKQPATAPAEAGRKASRILHPTTAQERRRIMIVGGGLFLLLGSGIVLAMVTDLPSALALRTTIGPRDTFGIEERNGSIVLPAADNKCRQIAFNNDTGRMVESNRPCSTRRAVDEKGVPIPEATIRRLDTIRQGFAR